MLTQINTIKDCGLFKDFKWDPNNLNDMSKYNLIYGWNGTGKSTISNILRDLELRQPTTCGTAELTWDQSITHSSSFASSRLPIKVFNEAFVKETMEGELRPISVLGKANIDRKKRLETLTAELESHKTAVNFWNELYYSRNKVIAGFCTQIARAIKDTLGQHGNTYTNYNKTSFQRVADALLKCEQSEQDSYKLQAPEQEKLLQQTRARMKTPLPLPDLQIPCLTSLRSQVSAIRSRSPISEIITELSTNHDISQWVQTGIELHEKHNSKNTCLYCNSEITSERLNSIAKHFNNELIEQQSETLKYINLAITAIDSINKLSLPTTTQLSEILAEEGLKVTRSASLLLGEIKSELTHCIELLSEKQQSPFDSLQTEHPNPLPCLEPWNALKNLIQEHNRLVENHTKLQSDAFEAYELARISECIPTYKEHLDNIKNAEENLNYAKSSLANTEKQIRQLREELMSNRIPAEELTRDLSQYLGHKELTFELQQEGYRITRRGSPATRISDGERTAIAILYFLKTLRDVSFDLPNALIVFDDPVSSLDSNALYNAFAFIKDRTQSAKQLIILTHNFQFFRLVRDWLENLRGPDRNIKRYYTLKVTHDGDSRISTLAKMDRLLIVYESEYQFLFGQIYQLAQESQTHSIASLVPAANMARRVLEAFLAFKSPFFDRRISSSVTGSFYTRLDNMDNDKARVTRIYRFCNSHSHLNAVGAYDEDISFLSSGPGVLKDVLNFIEEVDPPHFQGMVNSVRYSQS